MSNSRTAIRIIITYHPHINTDIFLYRYTLYDDLANLCKKINTLLFKAMSCNGLYDIKLFKINIDHF